VIDAPSARSVPAGDADTDVAKGGGVSWVT